MRSSDGEPGGGATRWRRRRRGNTVAVAVAVAAAAGPRGKEAGRVTGGRWEEEGRRATLDSERFRGSDLGIFGQLFTQEDSEGGILSSFHAKIPSAHQMVELTKSAQIPIPCNQTHPYQNRLLF